MSTGGTVTGPMIASFMGAAFMLWISIQKDRDGGFVPYGPPRSRPDILKKLREENPPEPVEDISKRYNRIPFNRVLLAIDYDNLHLYGVK